MSLTDTRQSGGGSTPAKTLLLSVLIPVYNEEHTIREVIERVAAVPIRKEIIAVDDASRDGSWDVLNQLAQEIDGLRVFRHEQNQGKGAAIRTAIRESSGDVVIIQDADLEYDPEDYPRLLAPIAAGRAKVVYGYRTLETQKPLTRLGNQFLTLVTNLLYGTHLKDMETCYKMLTREVIDSITVTCNRFDIEPEITAKIAKRGYRIHQIPIAYAAREDKKLNPYKDGWPALSALFRFRFKD